jgi:glycine/D-amino acid oxidase-like deaminating enzyme
MKPRFAPFWYDRFPDRRRPALPRHRAPLDTQVVVVGGGLTGCACASVLAAARIPVVLLEAGRVGAGATAGAVGLDREDFDGSFEASAAAHGLRAARTMWQAMRRASLEFPAALRRLDIKCDLQPQDLLTSAGPDRAAARALRHEYDSRRAAGLEHHWVTAAELARQTALAGGGALRTRGLVFDPYRACLGLSSSAAARGALLFERSAVLRIRAGRKKVEVHTSAGVIQADTVVVTTGSPDIKELRPLQRHLHRRHGYGVVTEPLPAAARRQVGQRGSVLKDLAAPPHTVRWLKEDRVLITGADQAPVAPRLQAATLVQRTGQLMYELSLLYPPVSGTRPEWAWSYTLDDTADGLPYIGAHRNFPRHLFALGLGRHGAAASWLAARLVQRLVTEQPAKGDELFAFSRILAGH